MNRRNAERLSADSHELASKQRIVRRKDPRSPSPQLTRSASHREVRTSASADIYSKIGPSHRSNKYVDFRHSSGDLREERLGGSKERGFAPRHHENLENHGDMSRGGAGGRSVTGMRKGSNEVGGAHQSSGSPYYDKFEYSLHVSNLNSRLTDGETKVNLFREFKKYGYVNIKVIGYGKERHAFINFTRLEDARTALNDMNNSHFYGENLVVTWSRSTVNRYPHIDSNTTHNTDRHPVGRRVSKSRSFQAHEGTSVGFFNDHFQDSPRNSRDINYHQQPSPVSSSRNHAVHSNKEVPAKTPPGAIVDPNATRTLFVGNLEADVTERELRDLFSPYGRIECVDIKVQRSISTAYAFVKFFTITDAMNAKNDMHGRKYGNIKLKIGFGKGSPSAKVWVGNLTDFADLAEVRSELDRFGLIRRVDYNNGDSHAFVHFDSLDAAQTAVNSLTTYRFRNSNRPLKIDLSQPIPRPGSDFEDFESEFHEPIPDNSRQVHSHNMSPDISPHPVISRRGGVSGSEDFTRSRQLSHERGLDRRIGAAAIKSSFRSNRGRRVVTEVQDHTHSRHNPVSNTGYIGERNTFRKRGRSPSMSESDNRSSGGFNRHQSQTERGGGHSNGHRMGGTQNGDLDYKAKRPKNGFDAYRYHELHGSSITVNDRIGSSSSTHSERDREFRDKEFRDRSEEDRQRDRRGDRRERDSREHSRDNRRRSSSVRSDRKGDPEDRNPQRKNSDLEIQTKTEIEKISPPPPPPPPPPPIMEMMSYETSDPALKLNDSTGPVSPTGGNQPGIKADFKIETLSDMTKVYPVVWHGNMVLKNTGFPTRMLLIGGDPAVAELLLRCKDPKDEYDSLRITQRLRLEPARLEEVNKRMSSAGPSGHCILLALPGAIPAQPPEESGDLCSSLQLRPLKSLVSYLEQKEAAGIVALNATDMATAGAQRENIIGVLHAFPPCEFSQNQLLKIAPDLGNEPAKEDHVVVLLVKGTV